MAAGIPFHARSLVVEPLTAKAFAPFGDVIAAGNAKAHYGINQGFAERHHDVTHLDAAAEGGRAIVSIFSAQPTSHWLGLLEGHMPVAPVYGLDMALDNPFIHSTGMVQTTDHPDLAGMRVLCNPIRLDGTRLPTQAAPLLGADTDAILGEIGYDEEAIARLRSARVV